jgi:hypothetical protein
VYNVTEKEFEIIQAVNAIKFGTVLVVINNAKIVQIESTNKKRFDLSEQTET